MASDSMAVIVMDLGPGNMTTTAVAGGAPMSSNGGGTSSLWTCDWFMASPCHGHSHSHSHVGCSSE